MSVLRDRSLNLLARDIRRSLGLKQQELAVLAGVSKVDVDSFESSLPVALEYRNKILKTLCHNVKRQTMRAK